MHWRTDPHYTKPRFLSSWGFSLFTHVPHCYWALHLRAKLLMSPSFPCNEHYYNALSCPCRILHCHSNFQHCRHLMICYPISRHIFLSTATPCSFPLLSHSARYSYRILHAPDMLGNGSWKGHHFNSWTHPRSIRYITIEIILHSLTNQNKKLLCTIIKDSDQIH